MIVNDESLDSVRAPPSVRNSGRRRVRLFGVDIDRVDCAEAARLISAWLADGARPSRLVVTPNVNHVVRLDSSPEFRRAYAKASLVVADGWPVVAASRWLGEPLPGRVAGSDLVPAVFDHVARHWRQPMRVFLLGAAPGVADRAAGAIESAWQNVAVVGTCSPRLGFADDADECRRIGDAVRGSRADLLVIGLGAPQQEVWAARHAHWLGVKVAVCAGATIDFLAGQKPRAPRWMRRSGLEWLHRAVSEPRRLGRRYARDAVAFPKLLLREWRSRR